MLSAKAHPPTKFAHTNAFRIITAPDSDVENACRLSLKILPVKIYPNASLVLLFQAHMNKHAAGTLPVLKSFREHHHSPEKQLQKKVGTRVKRQRRAHVTKQISGLFYLF